MVPSDPIHHHAAPDSRDTACQPYGGSRSQITSAHRTTNTAA